jgi:hypothetical protein
MDRVPNSTIQRHIDAHGRIEAVQRMTDSEYSVKHTDGFAYIVKDARAAAEGPIRSVELIVGNQVLAVHFERLWTSRSFIGPAAIATTAQSRSAMRLRGSSPPK